jgi:perosamine synthetase
VIVPLPDARSGRPRLDDLRCIDATGVRSMIPVYRPSVGDREKEYVNEALESTWISSKGKFLDRFEAEFAQFAGARHGVATANGTVSLHLAFAALGIGPGDEVIVPTFTYVASVNAIAYTGAKPVFVDSDPVTWNIDPTLIEAAVTPRTRAIEAVHLYGHPADMDPITDIAARHGLSVVEDAAEAHGATYKGRPVGSLGTVASFSFYGNKIVTTGEGGMLVTDDAGLAATARHLRGQGVSATRTYWHDVVGFNYRMTNVAAAIGCAQLERVEATLAAKRQIAAWYRTGLDGVRSVELQVDAPWAEPVHWMLSVLVNPAIRDALIEHLAARGIESRPFFYPAHTLPMYPGSGTFPVAERLGASGINLPSWPGLSEAQVDEVASALVSGIDALDKTGSGARPEQ